MNLMHEVIMELEKARGHWPKVSEETGASYSYLSKLVRGEIKNPSYNKLLLLHEYLTNKSVAA